MKLKLDYRKVGEKLVFKTLYRVSEGPKVKAVIFTLSLSSADLSSSPVHKKNWILFCINCSSYCCNKAADFFVNQLRRGLLWLTGKAQWREGEVAASHDVHSQEAERGEGWGAACFLLFTWSETAVSSGRDFPVQINLSGNTLLAIPRSISGCF